MNIKTNISLEISTSSITKDDSRTAIVFLSFSYLNHHSASTAALGLLYKDLILSGTKSQTRENIQYNLKRIGANIDVSLEDGKIKLTATSLEANQNKLLSILSDILINSTFSSKEIKRAKNSLTNRLELVKENSRLLADVKLKNSFYQSSDHQYSFLPEELIKQTNLISTAQLKNYNQLLLENHWSITVSGNKKTVSNLLKKVSEIKPINSISLISPKGIKTKSLSKREVVLTEVKSKQNIEIAIGGQLPLTLNDPELPAFIFGLAVLGKWSGFSGRLMSIVREKEGLTYGIYAKTEKVSSSDTGYWRIMTFFSPKDVKQGLASTLREIDLISQKGITKSEFTRFQEIIKTSNTLVFDSLSKATALVHGQISTNVTWDEYLVFYQKLLNCSMKEINLALKKYLRSDKILISAAGPIEKVKKELLAFKK